ncbi:MAG: sigma-70 family RNA polymerase sigma factor [Saprospiraceae bacterium]|nr:sigma-70 family RNA polymerase sigma factor [Lewinella sp.]
MSREFYQEYIENNRAIITRICRAYADTEADFQDHFQEVCLQLWRSRDNFRQQAQLSTWIYRVSLNVCLSLVRKKEKQLLPQEHADRAAVFSLPEANPIEAQQLETLYRAIRQLKQADRAVILLYLEEKTYEEMAQILGISISNVGVRINRIKERLKKYIYGGA